ncbi:MAG TPA: HEAT repeat domain-containing protein [Gemmatimonadaceae bacterium]|nr:HEAT repeat domain-containing protein [Gemmatimonadaceae bacterium]
MKRLTLVLTIAFAAPAFAQQPSKAPREPRAPRSAPKIAMPEIDDLDMELRGKLEGFDLQDMALAAADLARTMDLDMLGEKMAGMDFDMLGDKVGGMLAGMDLDAMLGQTDLMVAQLDLHAEDMAMHGEALGRHAEELARHMADMPMLSGADMLEGPVGIAPRVRHQAQDDAFLRSQPRAPWRSDDPADSLYRAAREALNRGEYRRAAQLFNDITQKFPKSEYNQDCRYWEAFSRYRLGGTDDLRQALKILDGIDGGRITLASRESAVDIPALRARVQGALAARGDKESEERLKRDAAQNDGCDREEVSVRAEALAALGQMDMQAALPVVRKVLARRDACTVELRRRALYLVGRQGDSSAAAIILDVAKNDTDAGIRGEAMRWLPRVAGESAVPQLEELLRTSSDEQTQRAVVWALGAMDGDRARRAIRAMIERPDASERLRYDAIVSITREREGRSVTADDIAYLRTLYGKLESARLREAVLMSLSRTETAENQQFLFAVARNENEQPSLRAAATQRLGRMQTVTASDIAKLYAVADARSLREQILYALSQRKEPEAIDKMMEIARKDTDPQIRRTAISLLARSNNERAKKLLQELIDQ